MALLDKGDNITVSAPKAQENNQYMGFSVPFCISLSGYSLEREDEMYDIKKTGKIIKKLRMQNGKSQEAVAMETGINIKTYRSIETGVRGSRVDTLCALAEYYNVTLDYLVFGNDTIAEVIEEKVWKRLDMCKQRKVIKIIKFIIDILEW